MTLRASFALALGVAVAGSACFEPLDTTREDQPGTFGHIVLDLACQRVAYLEDLNDGDGKVDVRGDDHRAMCKAFNPIPAAPEDAGAPLKALQATRERTTAAVDAVFPEDFLGDLQGFLSSNDFLSAYDDDTATAAIDALIGVLRLMAEDDEAMAALERLNVRLGYKPLEPGLGVVRSVVNYPGMNDMLLTLTEAITPGGSARAEWENLVEAVGASMRDAQPSADTDASQRTIQLALNLLMSEQALLGTDRTIELVRRDNRGLAQVGAPLSTTKAPRAKSFVDDDGDGLADVDGDGRLKYVDDGMTMIAAPSPFALAPGDDDDTWAYRDPQGRALDAAGGAPLYRYVDLDKTVLTALARDSVDLFDPGKGTALDLLRGTSALMGGRVEATKTFDSGEQLAYRGYDLSQSALLDMLYGYLQILRDPNIYYVLGLGKQLIANHEPQVARLAEAVVVAARKADAHPEAVIPANKALWDDLINGTCIKDQFTPGTVRGSCPPGFRFVKVIPDILAKPGLAVALMDALERPEVKGLSQHFFHYMTKKDRFPFNPTADGYPLASTSFVTPVDRAAPDDNFNRSIMQRLLHIIADSNGARMCNKDGATIGLGPLQIFGPYTPCELMQIDNLAVFYVQSIAEKAQLEFKPTAVRIAVNVLGDGFIESQSGIPGFDRTPSPSALNRVLALDAEDSTGMQSCPAKMKHFLHTVIGPVFDKDGHKTCAVHADTLQVWEVDNFYTQIRPIVQAFADNNAELLFVDFLTVLHKHWATEESDNHQTQVPTDANYVSGAGAMRYEALIGDMLEGGALLNALVDAAPIINGIAVTPTGQGRKTAPEILRDAGLYLLTAQPDLANRAGVKTSTTADGRPVPQLSPWQILADGYVLKQSRMTAAGAEGTAWSESISEVIDVLVRGVEVPAGNGAPATWRFQNPRLRGVSVALIDFVESRLRYHDTVARDRVAWLSEEMPTDLSDMLSGPVFAGAADFVLSLQAAPETRRHLEGLVQYLVDEIAYDEAFVASMTSVSDLAQLVLADSDMVPIARVVGDALRPERGWVEDQLTFFKRARQADKTEALTRMMRNLYSEYKPGHTAVGDLVDGISEVMRARPYDDLGDRYTAADFRALLGGIANFLDDERRGLRKFIDIIKHRNL
jgi:hypothetical protein